MVSVATVIDSVAFSIDSVVFSAVATFSTVSVRRGGSNGSYEDVTLLEQLIKKWMTQGYLATGSGSFYIAFVFLSMSTSKHEYASAFL